MSKPYVSVRSNVVYDATLKTSALEIDVKGMTSSEAYELVEALKQLTAGLTDALNDNNPFRNAVKVDS